MTFDKHELKLLAIAGGLAAPGQPVKLHWLNLFYDRPGEIQKLVDRLRAHNYITFDHYQGEFRVLWRPVLQVLLKANQTGELFTGERPLDAVLAQTQRVDLSFDANSCEMTRQRPEEQPPPPDAETRGFPAVSHASMPMPMPSMPMPESRKTHVHGPCNSGKAVALHEHGHGTESGCVTDQPQRLLPAAADATRTAARHEVGELARRSGTEIMADLRKLAPDLSNEHLEHWETRIEQENARLVNDIVRQARVQRRQIKNVAAWMNAAYLNGIRKAEKANQI